MNKEPLITAAVIVGIAGAVIGVLVAFGIPMTEQQQDAVLDLVLILAPIVVAGVVALAARWKVTPTSKVAAQENSRGVLVAGPASTAPNGTEVTVEPSGYSRQVDLDPPADQGRSNGI